MTTHKTETREQWLATRLELLKAEKELRRRSDELGQHRQELPWVRVDKQYRFDTDEGNASPLRGVGGTQKAAHAKAADGLDIPLGISIRRRLRLHWLNDRGATT